MQEQNEKMTRKEEWHSEHTERHKYAYLIEHLILLYFLIINNALFFVCVSYLYAWQMARVLRIVNISSALFWRTSVVRCVATEDEATPSSKLCVNMFCSAQELSENI